LTKENVPVNKDDGESEVRNNDSVPMRKPTETEIVQRHIVAVTCNTTNYLHMMGLPKNSLSHCRFFKIWDWLIGRFSVCSAVGVLPLSLQYSYDVVQDLLAGAHDIDEHFFHAPLRDNIPVLLGLLGVWNSTFLGYTTRALLPYAEALVDFPAHVQLVDMESNGKRVAIDGDVLHIPAGEIDFGDSGGNVHHAFYQIMHQGRVIPVDFIGFMESPRPIQLPGEALSSHDEFMSNFFAQPDALAYGKTLVDLMQEGVPDGLREHMVFPGNRPSSSLLMTRLDPFSIGQLLALYEHRTAVQGFIWGINSFDQFGLELGKLLSKHIRVQLAASRVGATVQGFNQSTSSLLEAYIAQRRQAN
jgi:glucose-6-phosphate isomerase